MGRSKKSLKNVLGKHQVKMYKQHKFSDSKKVAETKEKVQATKSRVKKADKNVKRRPVIPYSQQDSIFLVGEGDFSFALSLVKSHAIPPTHITATAFDSEPMVYEKYPWATQSISELRQAGVRLLFKVDATKLQSNKELRGRTFTRITFNFPHAGKGITDQNRNVRSNQELVSNFFASVAPLLALGASNEISRKNKGRASSDDDEAGSEAELTAEPEAKKGTVLITLRDSVPYTLWEIQKLAKRPVGDGPPYKQLRSFAFHPDDYPGYAHRRTAGHRGEREIPVLKVKEGIMDARTWEFELA